MSYQENYEWFYGLSEERKGLNVGDKVKLIDNEFTAMLPKRIYTVVNPGFFVTSVGETRICLDGLSLPLSHVCPVSKLEKVLK